MNSIEFVSRTGYHSEYWLSPYAPILYFRILYSPWDLAYDARPVTYVVLPRPSMDLRVLSRKD
jgi:hypothetical protein